MKPSRAALAALLLVSPSAVHGARGNPKDKDVSPTFGADTKVSSSKKNTVMIGAQEVDLDEQFMAGDNEVTLIVRTKNSNGDAKAKSIHSAKIPYEFPKGKRLQLLNVAATDASQIMKELVDDPNIQSVEIDRPVKALPHGAGSAGGVRRRLTQSEPYGIGMVLEDMDFWNDKFATPPPAPIKVCVVDTGYDNGHVDLPNLDQNEDGFNPYDSGEWYIDGHSHGTHCAGTIGAVGDNGEGVVGVIPGNLGDIFSFFIGKGLTDSGSGSTSGVMAAVEECVEADAKVISMSLGGSGFSDSANDQYYGHYKDDDVLIIAAAGNGGNSAYLYPASYKAVMSVAAVDSNENRASFSQYSDQTEISGPGVGTKSTIPDDKYASYSGTSMATPHVAGVAGLLRAYFPDCKAFQIRNAMIQTARDKGDDGCDHEYGHGIVSAKQAFIYLEDNGCDTNAPFKEPEGGCAEFSCVENSDCDDGNPNSIDTCSSGGCSYACANDAFCEDGLACTIDKCEGGECSSDRDPAYPDIVLELTTDDYPAETSWVVTNDDDTSEELGEGSGYTQSGTLHEENICITESMTARFTITDSYGDGICCGYGSGGYVIKLNDEQVAAGGNFGASETTTFDVTVDSTPCEVCDDKPTNWQIKNGLTCEADTTRLRKKCNTNRKWRQKKYCQLSCFKFGKGYEGDNCCDSTDES